MTENTEAVALTADIVSAYVSNNTIDAAELAGLINQVHQAVTQAANGRPPEPEAPPTPAVPVKKSITHEYLISLEDGRKYKSLKRHLSTRGMSPDDYRAKWGLAKDYPMVAASYSAQRSSLAKSLGLGRARAGAAKPHLLRPKPRRRRRLRAAGVPRPPDRLNRTAATWSSPLSYGRKVSGPRFPSRPAGFVPGVQNAIVKVSVLGARNEFGERRKRRGICGRRIPAQPVAALRPAARSVHA